ncbi:MAG: hypothetical protein KAI83_01570 [Thiomargarita sp.]|nr:hypothetical protein [Thiomargarita sp.]
MPLHKICNDSGLRATTRDCPYNNILTERIAPTIIFLQKGLPLQQYSVE